MTIVADIVLLLLALAGVGYWQHHDGANAQKVADQVQIDAVNKAIADQKAQAAQELAVINARNTALLAERDKLKTDLGQAYAKDLQTTLDNRRGFDGYSLRIKPDGSAITRPGGAGAGAAGSAPAAAAEPAALKLSATITSDLRQLAFDADMLADAYRLCYGFATKAR